MTRHDPYNVNDVLDLAQEKEGCISINTPLDVLRKALKKAKEGRQRDNIELAIDGWEKAINWRKRNGLSVQGLT